MDIVADASAVLAVVLNEAARDSIIKRTADCRIVAPEVLPYEIGNALVVVRKKERLSDAQVLRAYDSAQRIAVTLLPVAVPRAIRLAMQFGIYAYDAYYLQCCIENRLPLLSLDGRMCEVAGKLQIRLWSEA
jgi:predicted nucleic acid-binding protein